jgi:hypothetical protein
MPTLQPSAKDTFKSEHEDCEPCMIAVTRCSLSTMYLELMVPLTDGRKVGFSSHQAFRHFPLLRIICASPS